MYELVQKLSVSVVDIFLSEEKCSQWNLGSENKTVDNLIILKSEKQYLIIKRIYSQIVDKMDC